MSWTVLIARLNLSQCTDETGVGSIVVNLEL